MVYYLEKERTHTGIITLIAALIMLIGSIFINGLPHFKHPGSFSTPIKHERMDTHICLPYF